MPSANDGVPVGTIGKVTARRRAIAYAQSARLVHIVRDLGGHAPRRAQCGEEVRDVFVTHLDGVGKKRSISICALCRATFDGRPLPAQKR